MQKTNKNQLLIKKMATIAVLAALALVVGLIEIPAGIPTNPALKYDLSDIITVVAIVVLGLKETSIMLIIKSIARYLIIRLGSSPHPLMGLFEEFMALFSSFMYVFAYLLVKVIFKDKKSIKTNILKIVFSVSFVIVTMVLFNFIISTPAYSYFVGYYIIGKDVDFHLTVFTFVNDPAYDFMYLGPIQAIGINIDHIGAWPFLIFCVITYLPFNLIKGLVSIVVGDITANRLVKIPFLNFNNKNNQEEIETNIENNGNESK